MLMSSTDCNLDFRQQSILLALLKYQEYCLLHMFVSMYTYIIKMCENTPSFENINKVCVNNFSNKW